MSEELEELDLLAFRYIAGEMDAHEAGAFEVRLADDQAAREAVSRAVGLSERLLEAAPAGQSAALQPGPLSRERAGWTALTAIVRPVGWMATGAAIALLAANVGRGPIDPQVPPAQRPARSPAHPPADALVWSRLQADEQWAAAALERWLDEPYEAETRETPSPAAVPSWVFAAAPQKETRGMP